MCRNLNFGHWEQDFENRNAGVSELADETDSKSVIRKGVWVRVPPPAPNQYNPNLFPIGDGLGFIIYLKYGYFDNGASKQSTSKTRRSRNKAI